VPVVLRDCGDGLWALIGEAYVHGQGVMDGEAASSLSLREEDFVLK
jgi:hypothetical protein